MAEQRASRRLSPNLIALLVLVALGAALLAWQRPWATADTPTDFPAGPVTLLRDQLAAMSNATDERSLAEAAKAPEWAARTWSALEQLGIDDVHWSYVRGGTAPDRADGSTVAVVRVEWTRAADSVLGAGTGRDEIGLRVRPSGAGFMVTGIESSGRPQPLWAAGDIDVVKDAHTTLVRIDHGGEEVLPQQLGLAREAVAAVVPNAGDRLVVIAPAKESTTAALLGRTAADVKQIAGVTARVGGGDAPVTAIVLNPRQFAEMDGHAQQVVLNHEATHMLTGGVGSPAPVWVLEGFADFVAFHGDTHPVSVNARSGLAEVRKSGPPTALPTPADFGTTTHGLGALYEQTWLLFRMLGERYGDDAVVAFYNDVLTKGTPEATAVGRYFGLTTAALVREWGRYLQALASDAG